MMNVYAKIVCESISPVIQELMFMKDPVYALMLKK